MNRTDIHAAVLYHPIPAPRRLYSRAPDLAVLSAADPGDAAVRLSRADDLITKRHPPLAALAGAARLRWNHVMGARVDRLGASPPGLIMTRVRGTFGPRIAEEELVENLPRFRSGRRLRTVVD